MKRVVPSREESPRIEEMIRGGGLIGGVILMIMNGCPWLSSKILADYRILGGKCCCKQFERDTPTLCHACARYG